VSKLKKFQFLENFRFWIFPYRHVAYAHEDIEIKNASLAGAGPQESENSRENDEAGSFITIAQVQRRLVCHRECEGINMHYSGYGNIISSLAMILHNYVSIHM
jgi:hypothetical protein